MPENDLTLTGLVAAYQDLESRAVDARVGLGQPLRVDEHLALLSHGDAVRRRILHARQSQVSDALRAGATWIDVAAATGLTVAQARRDFARWQRGQRAMRRDRSPSPSTQTPHPLGVHVPCP